MFKESCEDVKLVLKTELAHYFVPHDVLSVHLREHRHQSKLHCKSMAETLRIYELGKRAHIDLGIIWDIIEYI